MLGDSTTRPGLHLLCSLPQARSLLRTSTSDLFLMKQMATQTVNYHSHHQALKMQGGAGREAVRGLERWRREWGRTRGIPKGGRMAPRRKVQTTYQLENTTLGMFRHFQPVRNVNPELLKHIKMKKLKCLISIY